MSEAMARPAFIVLVLLAALAVPHAWAQRAPSHPPTEGGVPGPARSTAADVLLSSSVIGARVQGRDGTDLGEIHQLVLDRRTGYVSHAILDVSGPNAGGGTKVVLKWRDIQLMPDPSLPRRTVASVDGAVIERAPRLASTTEQGGPEPEPSVSPLTGLPGPGGPGPRD